MQRIIFSFAAGLALLGCTLLCTTPARAQQGLAHGGADGIIVDLGNWVLPASINGRAVASYRVERREAGGRTWTQVADVRGPASQGELETALASHQKSFPELSGVKFGAAELWQRLQTGRDVRSIGVVTRFLPVQLALGLRWMDGGASRATPYEYRISHIGQDGSATEAFVTPAVAWPGVGDVGRLQLAQTEAEPTSATMRWYAKGTPPTSFRMYRREGLSGPFSELSTAVVDSCCFVARGLTSSGDSVLAVVHDKTVQHSKVYQYYVVPLDYFRNEGFASDTATIVAFRMSHVPLPERMAVRSVDSLGLLLRWQLREPSAVHGIVIERGPAIDTGFVEIFAAAPSDTSWLDQTVTPMERYYYRLRLVGPGGLRSAPSAVLIGIWKSNDIPTPPQHVKAEPVRGGVRVEWTADTVQNIAGYVVHRADGYGAIFRQISDVLPVQPARYIDTMALRGDWTYLYTVSAVNSSHVPSAPSDTAYATPDIPLAIPAPQGVLARVDKGRVYLTWTMQEDNPTLSGWRVYRREGTSGVWRALGDTLLEASENHVLDEGTKPGASYAYRVRAYSIRGDSSETSAIVDVRIAGPAVYAPANLRAKLDGKQVLLTWDEIVQPGAKEFRIYRYTRGGTPQAVGTVPLEQREFLDTRPGSTSPVFYYVTTVSTTGEESRPGRESAVLLR